MGEIRITLDVALVAGQQITATQTFDGETSPSPEPVTVLEAPQELGHVVFGQVQGCAHCVQFSGVFPGATVEITSIRKRLGHKNIQTTLRYAEQSDAAADADMRAWRRRNMFS